MVVARQAGYHGKPFRAERGVTQGDVISPTIFNIVTDTVIRAWIDKCGQISDREDKPLSLATGFYADDE